MNLLEQSHFIDLNNNFQNNGWVLSHDECEIKYTLPGTPYKHFSIKLQKSKTVVSIPILDSDAQYTTNVGDTLCACVFLQKHLNNFLANNDN